MKIADCRHLPEKFAKPRHGNSCEENHICFLGIRVCLTCGYTGCCDSCAQHAREHAEKTGHRVIAYYPADEGSPIWCYADDDYLEPDETINMKAKTRYEKI